MLNKNPGLKDVCHSITGGSLAAQGKLKHRATADYTAYLTRTGYWMPFEAAKAVAATFCYQIRYVLTPIFGLDFPAQCIPAGGSGFDSMHVAPEIISECIQAAQECYGLHQGAREGSGSDTPSSARARSWTPSDIPPKTLKAHDSESGYGTDSERSDTYILSPRKRFRHSFRSMATSRSPGVRGPYDKELVDALPSGLDGNESEKVNNRRKRQRTSPNDTNADDDSSSICSADEKMEQSKRDKASGTPIMTKEIAANHLLQLCLEDASLRYTEDKRRASV
ncbi:MAG: hypothetical protein Q9220_005826 [cf. Caloplaca sp. 1 TL-2023]